MKCNQLIFRGILVFLMLGCYSALAQNGGDTCDQATEIQCGFIGNGSTTGASNDNAPFCGTGDGTGGGVWYKFVGDGGEATASLCGSSYDTKIRVFSGDCTDLTCVAGIDDFCSLQSEVSFNTVDGTTYFILVHGFGSATGDFTLTFSCTEPPQPIENDLCPDAISLACGETVTGTTEGATTNGQPGFCDFSVTAPGVWYTILGTGGMITLDTCGSDYDTKLSVYEGTCGNLNCVVGNDDDNSNFDPSGLQICGGTSFQSSLEFESTAGTLYYVYVHGFGSGTGNYVLNVDCACFVSIDSGDCQTVYLGAEPFASSSADLSAVGFGTGALTYEWSDGQSGADITVSPTETTVYTVTLTDDEGCTSTAETTVVVVDADCDNNPNTDKILICHRGETICVSPNAVQAHLDNHGDHIGPCDQLNCDTRPGCTAVTDPADGAIDVSTNTVISWNTAPGFVEGYRISIGTTSGGSDVVNNLDVGNVLSYQPDPGALGFLTTYFVTVTAFNVNGSAINCPESSFTTENFPCFNPTVLNCGDVLADSTDGVAGVDFDSTCFISDFGKWYSIVGDGSFITIDVETTDYDIELGLSSGDCDNLTNIDCADNVFTGNGIESVSFLSEVGTTYRLYVGHWLSTSTETGDYTITVSCEEVVIPANDLCENAIAVDCDNNGGLGYEGDTTFSTDAGIVNPDCEAGPFGDVNGQGVWFQYTATEDRDVVLSLCGASWDTKIDVYTGDCNALTCLDGNDDDCGLQSEITIAVTSGETYYIFVTGFTGISGTATGEFTLNVTCPDPPVQGSDDCADAVEIGCGDTVNGTTTGFTDSGVADCFDAPSTTSPGVWYKFEGTGDNVTISTCDSSYDTKLAVFSGDCSSLVCEAGNDDAFVCSSSGFHAIVDFATVPGTSYYIYVSGWLTSFGDYNLSVSCTPGSIANPNGLTDGSPWSLSPNPSIGTVDLNLRNFLESDVTIDVLDFTGKVLATHRLEDLQNPSYRLQLSSSLNNGMYLVRLSSDQHTSAKRLILNR